MKASINFSNEIQNFNSIKELKTFLNSALYYADEVVLFNHKANVQVNYSETNDIAGLISECNDYDEVLNVAQISH